ncbi:MAG: electron transfer flavoprotein subunit beta/FixA family protein [Candidatus Promineifilaceae bacterium]
MNIVVCVKQTPSTTAVFRVVDGVVSWEDPGGKPEVLNPWDEFAVEEALRVMEAKGGDVTAITIGDEASKDSLKTCLAMGCAEAVLINDEAFAGSDTLGTARVLAAAIDKIGGVQLAVFGRQAIDGDTGQTIVQTAVKLGWTPLTFVSKIVEIDESAGSITVERLIDEGKETVTARLPVVMSVVKEINEPRYPSFMGIRKASRAVIPVWSSADLDIQGETGRAASGVDWSGIYELPSRDTSVEIIEADSVEEQARILVDRLFEEKVI